MIWVTLALFAVSFLLTALLAPKPKIENARASTLDDLKFPQASEGSPLGLLLGRERVRAPNTLWYGDFRTKAITEKVKTGLFSSKRVTVGYRYYIGLDLGLCLGPGVRLRRIWIDKDEVWSGDAGPAPTAIEINRPDLFGGEKKGGGFSGTLRYYGGENSQPANAYVEGIIGDTYPGYSGQAHIVLEGVYIGTSATLRPMSFELERVTNGLGLPGGTNQVGDDLNPMELLFQLLTLRWGGMGLPTDDLNSASLISAAATLHSEGNGMSLLVTRANNGAEVVDEVLRQADAVMYQDPETSKIETILIRSDYDVEDLPVFDPSNVVRVRNFSRTSWDDTLNQVRVNYPDRSKKYETSSALSQDMANINMQAGRLRSTNVSFPGVHTGELANKLAAREMAQLSVPLYKVSLEVNRHGSQLRPGDPFVFSWPEYGIEQVIMRVQRFNLGELIDGRIVVDAVQDEFASTLTVFAPPEAGGWEPVSRDPADISARLLMEAPYFIISQADPTVLDQPRAGRGYVFALARQPNGVQQGYSAYVSQDGFSSQIVGIDSEPYTNTALLHTPVAATDGFADGLLASMVIKQPSPDAEFLAAASESLVREGQNLLVMNGELMAFQTLTDNGNGTWTLGTVRRALLDTRFEDHVANDVAYFIGSIDGLVLADLDTDGSTNVQAKFQSFTDKGVYPLDSITAAALTPDRRYERPLPPDYVTFNASRTPGLVTTAGPHDLAWRGRSRLDGTIRFENDAAQTPEPGTTYTLRFYIDDVLQVDKTQTNIATASTTLTLDSPTVGDCRVEITAVRDGLESFKPAEITFAADFE